MAYKTYTGVVLKRQPYREADEVLTLWSWEEGKTRLLARSVKKSASKLKGAISPLSWVTVEVVPSDFLPLITGARVIKSYPNTLGDLQKLSIAFNIFEMVLRATPDFEPNSLVALLLRESLDYLEFQESVPREFLLSFQLRFFKVLGYQLVLDRCSSCQRVFPTAAQDSCLGRAYWSFLSMGIVCEFCAQYSAGVHFLDDSLLQFLRSLQNGTAVFPAGSSEVALKAEKMLTSIFHSLTERELNSARFSNEIKKLFKK